MRVSNRRKGQAGGIRRKDQQVSRRELQTDFHHSRIIENALIPGKFIQSCRQPQGGAVGPMGAHGLYHIGHAQDPGL